MYRHDRSCLHPNLSQQCSTCQYNYPLRVWIERGEKAPARRSISGARIMTSMYLMSNGDILHTEHRATGGKNGYYKHEDVEDSMKAAVANFMSLGYHKFSRMLFLFDNAPSHVYRCREGLFSGVTLKNVPPKESGDSLPDFQYEDTDGKIYTQSMHLKEGDVLYTGEVVDEKKVGWRKGAIELLYERTKQKYWGIRKEEALVKLSQLAGFVDRSMLERIAEDYDFVDVFFLPK